MVMPPKEMSATKIFFRTNAGEHVEIEPGGAIELTEEKETEMREECISFPENREMTFEFKDGSNELIKRLIEHNTFIIVGRAFKRTILCNNWRRMHGLSLISRRGMRK